MKSTPQITNDEIAQRAHDIWEQSGRLDGHALDHWLRAERELHKERMQAEELRVGIFESQSTLPKSVTAGSPSTRRTVEWTLA